MSERTYKENKARRKRSFPWRNLLIFFIVIAVLLAGAWLIRSRPGATEEIAGEETDVSQVMDVPVTAAPATQYQGASYCQALPAFIEEFDMQGWPVIGTSMNGFIGFTVAEQTADGIINRVFQHPSWEEAGYLGAYVRDGDGNVYVAPVPFSSVELNDPELQTLLHVIGSEDGVMRPFLDVPAAQAPTEQNPYGVMGLFFDCDTNSLYAASIAGSTSQDEVGRIVRIDIESGEVVDQLEDIDALGVGVHNGVDDKRLYFGLARNCGVASIALDEEGHFKGEPRQEIFLAGLPGGGNEKAQRITFNDDGQMIIKGIEFDYTLRSSSDPERVLYSFTYVPTEDVWDLDNVEHTTAPINQQQ